MAHISRLIVLLAIYIAPMQLIADENHLPVVVDITTDSSIEVKTADNVSVVLTPGMAVMYENEEGKNIIVRATYPLNNSTRAKTICTEN